MKRSKNILVLQIIILIAVSTLFSQNVPPDEAKQSVVGEVKKTDRQTGRIEIRTDDKKDLIINAPQNTVFLKIKQNEKDLKNAEKISISQIGEGSRILARGKFTADNIFTSSIVIAIVKTETGDNAKNQITVAGTITAIDPATKQIKAAISPQAKMITLTPDDKSPKVDFYQYSADSLKFNKATASSFDRIKAGDQFKAVGKFVGETEVFIPETLVFGTFRTIGGRILSIDPATKQIKLEDVQSKKTMDVTVGDETIVKILDKKSEESLIDTFSNSTAQPGSRNDLRTLFDALPTSASNQLSIGDDIIFSAMVIDGSKVSAFYVLKDTKAFFSYLEKRRKAGQPLPNLGGINL